VTDAHHNQTAVKPTPWPFSGRGEKRPQTARAKRTNDPFRLPDELHGQSPGARRWRDLVSHYSAQLGAERMKREDVRARVRSLVWLTIEIERLHDERVCDKPVPLHTLLHMTQELRTLIAELGLSTDTRSEAGMLGQVLRNGSSP
jgi:hypothetical protein